MSQTIKNKGIVMSEVLCYITIFSVIMSVIVCYAVMVSKINKDDNKVIVDKSLEIQRLIFDIEDSLFLIQEDLYVVEEKSDIAIYGKKSNNLYLYLSKNVIYSDVLKRSLEIEMLDLVYFIEKNFIVIKSKSKNFNYIINLECKK